MNDLDRHHSVGKRVFGVMAGFVLLLAAWAGSASTAVALPVDAGYPLEIRTSQCSGPPPNPPTFEGSDCTPAAGVDIEVYEVGGGLVGSCTTAVSSVYQYAAVCTVVIPYDIDVAVHEVNSTLPAGYAPVLEPIHDSIPPADAGPPDGVVLPPIFINLPVEDDGGLVEQLVQVLITILDGILNGTPHEI